MGKLANRCEVYFLFIFIFEHTYLQCYVWQDSFLFEDSIKTMVV